MEVVRDECRYPSWDVVAPVENAHGSGLMKYHLIILDELGFVPFSQTGAQMLFNFISQRYQHGSLIVTSNLAFAEWTEVFGDPRFTSALLDRMTHHCHILEFSGKSYRFRQSLQRQTASVSEALGGSAMLEETVSLPPST